MKKGTSIKADIKSIAIKLKKEIAMREQYFLSKPETWQESLTGDRYSVKTEIYQDLFNNVESGCIDLNVKI